MSTLSAASPSGAPASGFNKAEYMREYKRRRMQDPEYRAKQRGYQRVYQKKRYATDPEYRAKSNEYQRVYQKNKRATDPEYRARREASRQKYLSKLRALDAPPSN